MFSSLAKTNVPLSGWYPAFAPLAANELLILTDLNLYPLFTRNEYMAKSPLFQEFWR